MTPKRTPPKAAASKVPRRKERELSAAIIALLRAHGILAWRTGGGAFQVDGRYVRMGTKGVSDVLGVVPWCVLLMRRQGGRLCQPTAGTGHDSDHVGRLLAIEVKSPTGRVRPEQAAFLQDVARHGGIAFVARSTEEVCEKLGLGR